MLGAQRIKRNVVRSSLIKITLWVNSLRLRISKSMHWWLRFRDCKRKWPAWNRFLICDRPCINHRKLADPIKECPKSQCLTKKVLARSIQNHWNCWLPRLGSRLTRLSWLMISRLVIKIARWSPSTGTSPISACGETWRWTMWSTRRVTPPMVVHQRTFSQKNSLRSPLGTTRTTRGWTLRMWTCETSKSRGTVCLRIGSTTLLKTSCPPSQIRNAAKSKSARWLMSP